MKTDNVIATKSFDFALSIVGFSKNRTVFNSKFIIQNSKQ